MGHNNVLYFPAAEAQNSVADGSTAQSITFEIRDGRNCALLKRAADTEGGVAEVLEEPDLIGRCAFQLPSIRGHEQRESETSLWERRTLTIDSGGSLNCHILHRSAAVSLAGHHTDYDAEWGTSSSSGDSSDDIFDSDLDVDPDGEGAAGMSDGVSRRRSSDSSHQSNQHDDQEYLSDATSTTSADEDVRAKRRRRKSRRLRRRRSRQQRLAGAMAAGGVGGVAELDPMHDDFGRYPNMDSAEVASASQTSGSVSDCSSAPSLGESVASSIASDFECADAAVGGTDRAQEREQNDELERRQGEEQQNGQSTMPIASAGHISGVGVDETKAKAQSEARKKVPQLEVSTGRKASYFQSPHNKRQSPYTSGTLCVDMLAAKDVHVPEHLQQGNIEARERQRRSTLAYAAATLMGEDNHDDDSDHKLWKSQQPFVHAHLLSFSSSSSSSPVQVKQKRRLKKESERPMRPVHIRTSGVVHATPAPDSQLCYIFWRPTKNNCIRFPLGQSALSGVSAPTAVELHLCFPDADLPSTNESAADSKTGSSVGGGGGVSRGHGKGGGRGGGVFAGEVFVAAAQ
jgi:hypothetical protein